MRIFDLHNDYPTAKQANTEPFPQKHTVIHAFWTTELDDPLSFITNYIEQNPPNPSRKFAIEDLVFVKDEEVLQQVCLLPILYCGLTWNGTNALASGAGSEGGLTLWGEKVIAELEKNNIAIDTAHLNEKSFWQVAQKVKSPICTHTCLKMICGHPRNLSNAQIHHIIQNDGLVGLCTVAEFMGIEKGKAKLEDYLVQIDTYCQKFGTKNLALGTDFYGTEPLIDLYQDYTNIELIAYWLQKLGYKEKDIANICHKNAENFFSF